MIMLIQEATESDAISPLTIIATIIALLSLIGNIFQWTRNYKLANKTFYMVLSNKLKETRKSIEDSSQELLRLTTKRNLGDITNEEIVQIRLIDVTFNSKLESYISAFDEFCGYYLDKTIKRSKFDKEYKNSIVNIDKLDEKIKRVINNYGDRYTYFKELYKKYTGKEFS